MEKSFGLQTVLEMICEIASLEKKPCIILGEVLNFNYERSEVVQYIRLIIF
jgi:hypothetical protein